MIRIARSTTIPQWEQGMVRISSSASQRKEFRFSPMKWFVRLIETRALIKGVPTMRFTFPHSARSGRPRPAFTAVLAALAALVPASAMSARQEPAKPGPEHAIFKEWAGNWDATFSVGGSESKGFVTAKITLGGLWLVDELKANMAGMPFEGRGSMSYDPDKKKYIHVWIDSQSTRPAIFEGDYDRATKTLKMKGKMPAPGGVDMPVTQTLVTKDPNTRVFTLSGEGPDGKELEMLKVTYKRQPAKKAAAK
jgi:hypothetical protein